MPDLRRIGRLAEDRAAQHLKERGYTVVTRRYCAKGGEIDLIALDGETLVFVEVKQRRGAGRLAEEAVDARKIERVLSAAEQYLVEMEAGERPVRFDVIALDAEGLRHHVDAFRGWDGGSLR